jgi:hypothetical protein
MGHWKKTRGRSEWTWGLYAIRLEEEMSPGAFHGLRNFKLYRDGHYFGTAWQLKSAQRAVESSAADIVRNRSLWLRHKAHAWLTRGLRASS